MAQGLFELVLLPLVSVALVVWWVIGDAFSSAGGQDQLLRLPFATANAWALGIVGLAGVILAVSLLRRRRGSSGARHAAAAVVLAGVAGAGVGAGLRVLTATVHGANIGGGLTILFGPWLLVVLLAGASWDATRSAR